MAAEFTIAEAQERLEELIDRAESGEEIVITRFGAPSVTLSPTSGRRSGAGFAGGVIGAMGLAPVAGDVADGSFDVGTDYHFSG